jgi:hypothetical protein
MTTKRVFRAAALGAAVFSSFLFLACESSTVDKFPDPGQVKVHVNDQGGSAVSGATIDLLTADNALVWRSAVTDALGNASPGAEDGGVLPGNYNGRITPPAGYHLAPGQPNSVPITVQSNKQASLSIQILTGP